MVNILLQHSDSEKKEPCLESALVFAARGGHADTVKLLLDSGAEIDHFGEVSHCCYCENYPTFVLDAISGNMILSGTAFRQPNNRTAQP
jgi:ankyrin repeat protein